MTSSRPYLIRALHEWIVDNGLTPHILVDASAPGVEVPAQQVRDGKIILNLSPRAIRGLEISSQWLRFETRFGGLATVVSVPVQAVLGIYARENGQGMYFPQETGGGDDSGKTRSEKPRRVALKVVK